jgi:hypothetical protein
LVALKAGLLAVVAIGGLALMGTTGLPSRRPDDESQTGRQAATLAGAAGS